MKKLSLIWKCMIFFMLFTLVVAPVYAQGSVDTGVITLASLGNTGVFLNGPYDSNTMSFGLPSDWKLNQGGQLDLNITASFNTTIQDTTNSVAGGTLLVSFNRNLVEIVPLTTVGTFDYTIQIPAEYLVSQRSDGRMELRFELDSGISCTVNQQMNVIVNPTSRISFSYEQVQPNIDLINFPRPLYQSSIYPDFAYIAIPDHPTSIEMQSILTVAAGFGNLANGNLGLSLIKASQLTAEQQANSNIIFAGTSSSFPQFTSLPLTLPVEGGKFTTAGGNLDDGIVQMINSPWSVRNVILVVSGNTDAGTLKAARALSTGLLQSNASKNLAIIESVQDIPVTKSLAVEQTLADLGYSKSELSSRGVDSTTFNFYLPPGSMLALDSFFELDYGHSALLNYNLSGLVVLLNGQPVGSVRFTDVSAMQATNRVSISIPPFAALPGTNTLEIRSNLEPIDNCTNPNLRGLWAIIWPDSRLHLPLSSGQLPVTSAIDLTVYPAPMSLDSTLGSTAFVLPKDNFDAWQAALGIAVFLGDRSNGSISTLNTFFDEELTDATLEPYNLIVVGQPSKMTVMEQLSPHLPVPFEQGTDIADGGYLQVKYRTSPNVPVGYVELFASPWNKEKVAITAFGNTVEGVTWAASALGYGTLRAQLSGNFVMINGTQVQTTDTRLRELVDNAAITPGQPPVVTPISPVDIPTTTPDRPTWILPVLILTVVLIVIIVLFVLYPRLRRKL